MSWSELDQDKALAWRREQRKVCTCGTRAEEWEKDRYAYVGQQRSCPGCEVMQQETENVPESQRGYTYVYLTPREMALTPEQQGLES